MTDTGSRRWVRGNGAPVIPRDGLAILRAAKGRTKRWRTTARSLKRPDLDQVAVEQQLLALKDAGLIEIHERRNRRGDFEPYEWRITEQGNALIVEKIDRECLHAKLATFIQKTRPLSEHPVIGPVRAWLGTADAEKHPSACRILTAIGEEMSNGRIPTERTVSLAAFGNTKTARIAAYPEIVADVLGFRPEEVVRRAGQAVYAYGPFSFSVAERRIDGEWSRPWLALTRDTLEVMSDLSTTAQRLLTIENLTAFEESVRAGLPPDTVALYTGGFPGAQEMLLTGRFIDAGIRTIRHWSDIDLGGLRIFRYLKDNLKVQVNAYRMTPELLRTLPTHPLTDTDRRGLESWLKDPTAPLCELAEAMLRLNRKAEQEGWFLETH